MSQPTPYDRQFNFQNQALQTPDDPPPAEEMDSEFNAIKLTLDEILTNLDLIQRDDGALENASVARDTLHSSIDLGFGAPTTWHENTNYVADFDTIFHEAFFYKCIVTHLSDPSPLGFNNDIAKWEIIADFSAAAIAGLGTMSTQNADNVIITGGSITGTAVTVSAPDAVGKATPKSYVDDAISTLTAYVDAQIAALNATLSGKWSAPSGTTVLVRQAAAPVGWTFDNTHNDKALRIVNNGLGTGGTASFATVFGVNLTGAHTLIISEMPGHNHAVTDPAHVHALRVDVLIQSGSTVSFTTTPGGAQLPSSNTYGTSQGTLATASAGTGISIQNQGGGASHTHPMELRVQYVDFRIIVKD